jgi:hypothetical protein
MATTKGMLAEQIERIVQGGDPSIAARVHRNEIYKLIEQEANAALKAVRFTENLPEGDHYPTAALVAEYDNIPVVTYKTVSKATLPALPVSMPKGMGVWHVSSTTDINTPFIPLQSGQFGLIRSIKLLGELSGIIGYEQVGRDLIFTSNLVAQGVDAVYMRLLVTDLSTIGEYDLLPITPDMEKIIRDNIVQFLLGTKQVQADKVMDNNDKV